MSSELKTDAYVAPETLELLESMTSSIDYYRGTYFVCFVLSLVAIATTKLIESNYVKAGLIGLIVLGAILSFLMMQFEGKLENAKNNYGKEESKESK